MNTVRVDVLKSSTSDLLLAISGDLPGLMVAARDVETLKARLPAAIEELMRAGNRPQTVQGQAARFGFAGFVPNRIDVRLSPLS
jgi:hypothetical protein